MQSAVRSNADGFLFVLIVLTYPDIVDEFFMIIGASSIKAIVSAFEIIT